MKIGLYFVQLDDEEKYRVINEVGEGEEYVMF